MPLEIGQPAPDFTLQDTDRQPQTLSAYRGKNVLLLFFPLAFTSTCTAELCSVRDQLAGYQSLDVQPFGISVDAGPSLKRFKEDQNLNYPLLSDFNKEVSKLYETIYEDWFGMKGVSKRSAFLVDKNGVVQYAEVLENAGDQPNFDAIQVKLRSLAA
jgi:glutaredoxin-dependent peroxiredoxin